MKALIPDGYTRVLAENQNEYNTLAIKDVSVKLSTGVNGSTTNVNCMYSCWKPDKKELECLNQGGHIVLGILGVQFPPVVMSVSKETVKDCGQNNEK